MTDTAHQIAGVIALIAAAAAGLALMIRRPRRPPTAADIAYDADPKQHAAP